MKAELLKLLDLGRSKESETLVPRVDDSEPARPGEWTAKDLLAHLSAWREAGVDEIESARTGGPPPDISDDDDFENAKIYARTHQLTARAVADAASRSWDTLTRAFSALSEEELHSPRPRQPDQEIVQILATQAYSHLAAHLTDWMDQQGDEKGAEQMVYWARDVAFSAPVGDAARGAAEYNIGCFHAKRGRAAEALPYLRKGLELRPGLGEWAAKDSDLDPIRNDPEVARLLQR